LIASGEINTTSNVGFSVGNNTDQNLTLLTANIVSDETFGWNNTKNYFNFSDDIHTTDSLQADGNLTVGGEASITGTGAFAGAQIVNLTTADLALIQVQAGDYFVGSYYTLTGTGTVRIPGDVTTSTGYVVHVKDLGINASAYPLIVEEEGGALIDGLSNFVISGDGDSVSLITDGSGWYTF